MISKTFFNDLYEENKSKLKLSSAYEFYQTRYDRWVNTIKASPFHTPADVAFAQNVGRFFTLVSFEQWYETLRKVGEECKAFYNTKSDNIDVVILVVANKWTSSNFWTSLLLWPILRPMIDRIYDNVYDVVKYLETERQNALVIYADDAMYSGNDVSENLDNLLDDYVYEYPDRYIVLFLAIPFISQRAKTFILQNKQRVLSFSQSYTSIRSNFIMLPTTSVAFYNYRQWKEQTPFVQTEDNDTIPSFYGTADDTLHGLVFEFKLADEVSVYHYVFAKLPVKNGKDEWTSLGSIVKGCSKPEEQSFQCPPSYYKHIEWTFEKNPIVQDKQLLTSELQEKLIGTTNVVGNLLSCNVCKHPATLQCAICGLLYVYCGLECKSFDFVHNQLH